MIDELRNAAILLRRGSWVDPELFERAAKRMAELERENTALRSSRERRGEWLERAWNDGMEVAVEADMEITRLTARVEELEGERQNLSDLLDVEQKVSVAECAKAELWEAKFAAEFADAMRYRWLKRTQMAVRKAHVHNIYELDDIIELEFYPPGNDLDAAIDAAIAAESAK